MDNIHFRCAFNVAPISETEPVFAELVAEIARWVRSKEPSLELRPSWLLKQGMARRPDGRAAVSVDSLEAKKGGIAPDAWAMRYEHQDTEFAARRWTIDFGIANSFRSTQFSVVVGNSLRPGYIGKEPGHLPVTPPRIVREILTNEKWHCISGTARLSFEPIRVEVGKADQLIRVIEDPARSCPLVYVSRNRMTDETMVDANRLAKGIAGAAIVYVAASREIDDEIEFLLVPREFRAPNGTVRVYAPGVNFSAPMQAFRHRFFTRAQIEELTATEVESQIARALTRRQGWASVRPSITSVDDIAARRRELRRSELQSHTDRASQEELRQLFEDDNVRLSAEVVRLQKEKEGAEEHAEELEAKVDELHGQLRHIEFESESFRTEAVDAKRQLSAMEGAVVAVRQMRQLPKTTAEVVVLIERMYPGSLVFSDEAKKSAQASDADPAVAWECLQATAAVLPELVFNKGESAIADQFRNLTGFELTLTEGSQTKKDGKLLKTRRVTLDRKEWDISAHIKAGKHPGWLRIHFAIDRDGKRIIIGHCGDHLETAGTRRRK
jgi:hypothetical protein